ncbi:MAG: hypothetical protein IJ088_13045 [Clostridia bacterium]|nr:hypothetical protein [Clostridia bacterium]
MRKEIQIYTFDGVHAAERIVELQRENGYTLLFFSSVEMKNRVCLEAVVQTMPLFEREQGMLACSHTFHLPDEEYRKRMQYFKNRMIALTATKIPDGEAAEVNPNYFCDTIPKRELHDDVSVISVGMSQNRNELLRAADQLYQKTGKALKLVFVRKRENFVDDLIHLAKLAVIEVLRLRKLDSSLHQPLGRINRNVKRQTVITGRISFAEMFDRIEEADFIVINFYQGAKNTFSTCQTTGSKQLSLGFLIPCIIEKEVAEYYGFSEKNAVIYEDGHLTQALERATSMSKEEYAEKVRELKQLQREIRGRSAMNLEKMLGEP